MPGKTTVQFEDAACLEFGLTPISCLNSVAYGQSAIPTLHHPLWSLTWWWKTPWLLVVYVSIFSSMIAFGVKRIFSLFGCGLGTRSTQWFWLALWGR